MVVSLYIDLAGKIYYRMQLSIPFLEQEITGNKNWVFPDLVPFPLPISEEVPRPLLAVKGRKIDLDLSELAKEGELT